jgi:hypothetical protein
VPEKQRLLELAIKGLEAERARIDDEIGQIKSTLNGGRAIVFHEAGNGNTAAQPRKKRRMSAAARKKISEAMKRRYAAMNKAANMASAVAKVNKAPERSGSRLTAAGRKKLSDLMKKRWAERRKGRKK